MNTQTPARIIRGGSWFTNYTTSIVAFYRVTDSPLTSDNVNGFRTKLTGKHPR